MDVLACSWSEALDIHCDPEVFDPASKFLISLSSWMKKPANKTRLKHFLQSVRKINLSPKVNAIESCLAVRMLLIARENNHAFDYWDGLCEILLVIFRVVDVKKTSGLHTDAFTFLLSLMSRLCKEKHFADFLLQKNLLEVAWIKVQEMPQSNKWYNEVMDSMKLLVCQLWIYRKNRVKESCCFEAFRSNGFIKEKYMIEYAENLSSFSRKFQDIQSQSAEEFQQFSKLRRCRFCSKFETVKGEFRQCAKCKLGTYCSRKCNTKSVIIRVVLNFEVRPTIGQLTN